MIWVVYGAKTDEKSGFAFYITQDFIYKVKLVGFNFLFGCIVYEKIMLLSRQIVKEDAPTINNFLNIKKEHFRMENWKLMIINLNAILGYMKNSQKLWEV